MECRKNITKKCFPISNSKPDDADDAGWCWMMLGDAGWCWMIPSYSWLCWWFWMMTDDMGWGMLIDTKYAGWCWIMPVNARHKCSLLVFCSVSVVVIQSSKQCQQSFPCCTACLVLLALGAREIPYDARWYPMILDDAVWCQWCQMMLDYARYGQQIMSNDSGW